MGLPGKPDSIDTGSDIQSLQQFLNAQGFMVAQSGAGSPGEETTVFGNHTYQALIKFQAAHGLPTTGFFGPLTREEATSLSSSGGGPSANTGSVSSTTCLSATSTQAIATSATSPSQYIPGKTPLPGYAPGQIIFIGGGSPAPTPSCSISASPTSIEVGDSSTLTWTSNDASSASLDPSYTSCIEPDQCFEPIIASVTYPYVTNVMTTAVL